MTTDQRIKGAIVALLNYKGGVGKTTSTMYLATWFGNRGYRVLVVDADQQDSLSDWWLEADSQGNRPPFDMVRALPNELDRAALADQADKYDLVFVDCKPGADGTAVHTAVAAHTDVTIVPVKVGRMELWKMDDTIAFINECDGHHMVLLTMATKNSVLLAEIRDELARTESATFTEPIYQTQAIPRTVGHVPTRFGQYARVGEELETALAELSVPADA